jgi:hypothetical protein
MHVTEKPGPRDKTIIDERNERPLMIAFAAIVIVWATAFALTFTSALLRAGSANSQQDRAAVTLLMGR